MRLSSLSPRLLDPHRRSLATAAAQLEALSPVAVLARGYSIARNDQGDVIRSVSQVNPGDQVRLRVSDGNVSARVTSARPASDEPSGKE